MLDSNSPQLCIHRSAYNAITFDNKYQPTPIPSLCKRVKTLAKSHCRFDFHCLGRFFLARFPIAGWVYTYRLRKYLFGDILAGTTVAMLHLPQGMAYALLALQHPVYGLYTSMLYSFVYPIFGSSRHASLGTASIISLLTCNAIRDVTSDSRSNSTNTPALASSPDDLEKTDIAITLTFMVGCILMLFWILRLGFISHLFSRPFRRAYMAGASVHVFVSQLENLLGITTLLEPIPSLFEVPVRVYRTIEQVAMLRVNWLSILISAICILLLYIFTFLNYFLLKKRFPFPIPIQFLILVIFTAASYIAKFDANFGVETVGAIPRGIPSLSVPTPRFFLPLLVNAVIIAMVVFSIGISMVEVLADKHNYQVDANQELLAFGMCNIVSSFFFCIPGGVNLIRSLIQSDTGAKTQLSSIIAGLIILLVLLAVAPLFEFLPNPVLSSIVIVALHGMYLHVFDLSFYWRVSKYDLVIWIGTFLFTVVLNIEMGLVCGLATNLLVFVFRTVIVSPVLLGNLPASEFYVNIKDFDSVSVNSSIKIVQLSSPLFFANATKLKNFIIQQLPWSLNSEQEMGCGPTLLSKLCRIKNRKGELESGQTYSNKATPTSTGVQFCIILDCSCISFIDSVGSSTLCDINRVITGKNYLFFLAGASRSVREDLVRAHGSQWKNILYCIFPSIQDALIALNPHLSSITALN